MKKQIWVAIYSSLAVSVLTTTPVFMITNIPFADYPLALVFTVVMALGTWAVNIALFRFFGNNRVARYLLSYGMCLLLVMGTVHGLAFPRANGFGSYRTGFYFHIILFLAVDTVLLILQDGVVIREQNAELRMRNVEAANLLLKQQVHPHFLFNSLSTLKSLIRFSPADAEEYVVKLSGFLRSSMARHASALVTVEEELGLCRDYLDMQRIRFGEALQFSIAVGAEGWVPMFAVQGLIENAIKHNALTKERPLWIRVEGDGQWIFVVNNLQPRSSMAEEKGGLGLVALRGRYKALGEGNVIVRQTDTEFSVEISILKHADSDH